MYLAEDKRPYLTRNMLEVSQNDSIDMTMSQPVTDGIERAGDRGLSAARMK